MWHPRDLAMQTEWEVRYAVSAEPLAILRRLTLGGRVVVRAVTYAVESHHRELIGYFPNLDSAAAAVWRRYVRLQREQHERAAHVHGSRERGSSRR